MNAFIAAAFLLMAGVVSAQPFDDMIDQAAIKHNIDRIVFRAVIEQESSRSPWTFNTDGERFSFDSRDTAIRVLWQISKNPWMVKAVTPQKQTVRRFFNNRVQAETFAKNCVQASRLAGQPLRLRTDAEKGLMTGDIRVRQIWVFNTDIGIAQVNYRFHGVDRARVQQWFDVVYNLNYAASLIAHHKKGGKSDFEAAGDYHSKTPSVRATYLKNLRRVYEREKARALSTYAAN